MGATSPGAIREIVWAVKDWINCHEDDEAIYLDHIADCFFEAFPAESELENCPTCFGCGTIRLFDEAGPDHIGDVAHKDVECPNCNEGKIWDATVKQRLSERPTEEMRDAQQQSSVRSPDSPDQEE